MIKLVTILFLLIALSVFSQNVDGVYFNSSKAKPASLKDSSKVNSFTGEEEPRFSIGASFGAGIPLQNFSKSNGYYLSPYLLSGNNTSGNNYTADGSAKTGYSFNINAGYHFARRIGILLQLDGNINGVNTSASQSQAQSNGTNGSLSNYYIYSYLAGLSFSLFSAKKFNIGVHGLCGLMNVYYSEFKFSFPFSSNTPYLMTVDEKINPAITFGYDFGLNASYKISKRIKLNLSVDYLGGNPVFHSATSSSTVLGQSVGNFTDNNNYSMPTGLINANIGATFFFGKVKG